MFGIKETRGRVDWWLALADGVTVLRTWQIGGTEETGSVRKAYSRCVEKSWDGGDQSLLKGKDFLGFQLHIH